MYPHDFDCGLRIGYVHASASIFLYLPGHRENVSGSYGYLFPDDLFDERGTCAAGHKLIANGAASPFVLAATAVKRGAVYGDRLFMDFYFIFFRILWILPF